MAKKEWVNNQKSKGLCVECTSPVYKNTILCEKHRSDRMDRRKKKIENGICVNCQQPCNYPITRCLSCARKVAIRQKERGYSRFSDKYRTDPVFRAKHNAINNQQQKTKRIIVYKEYEGYCDYCQVFQNLYSDWEIDHRNPLINRGITVPENIALSCMPCNRQKSGKPPFGNWKKIINVAGVGIEPTCEAYETSE